MTIVIVAMFILSAVLLSGKGSLLIAGYNTMTKPEKQTYDEKKLCRVIGSCLGLITIIMAVFTYYGSKIPPAISWLETAGILIITITAVILANTICRKK